MANDKQERFGDKFYVYGPNTSNGCEHLWMFPTLDAAKQFAEHICKETYRDYLILEKRGRYEAEIPVYPVKWRDD